MKRQAFTLLELLLALTISSFVMVVMIRSVRNTQRVIVKTRDTLQANKSVCLFFNQIERDLNTAIIPTLAKKEKKKKDEKGKKKPPPAKASGDASKDAKDKEKEDEEKHRFFWAESDDEETVKIEGKKFQPFKQVTFINTNPLQIWGQKRTRFVRVGYQLVKNKANSTSEKNSYDLIRKETTELKNEQFKVYEEDPFNKKKQPDIRETMIAANVKVMFIEYVMPSPEEDEKDKDKKKKLQTDEEEQDIRLFSWGDTKETRNILPQHVELRITFWDDFMESEQTYECYIPIFAYPAEEKKKNGKKKPGENDKKKEQDKQGAKKGEGKKDATGSPSPPSPPGSPQLRR